MVTQNDPRSARGDIFYPLYFIIFFTFMSIPEEGEVG